MNSCYLLKWPAFILSPRTRGLMASAYYSCQPFWSLPIPAFQYIMTNIITSTSLFMDSTNRQARRACRVSINYSHGPLVAHPLGCLDFQEKKEIFNVTVSESFFKKKLWLLSVSIVEECESWPDLTASLFISGLTSCRGGERTLLWHCPFTNQAVRVELWRLWQ